MVPQQNNNNITEQTNIIKRNIHLLSLPITPLLIYSLLSSTVPFPLLATTKLLESTPKASTVHVKVLPTSLNTLPAVSYLKRECTIEEVITEGPDPMTRVANLRGVWLLLLL